MRRIALLVAALALPAGPAAAEAVAWTAHEGGHIGHTPDGATWVDQGDQFDPGGANAVGFVDATTGWVVGDSGQIAGTTDGGDTWVPQSLVDSNGQLFAVSAVDAQHAWAVGNGCIIAKTTDGSSWTWSDPFIPCSALRGVHFVTPDLGWIVGNTAPWIRRTANGGADWDPQDPGTSEVLNAVFFLDANTGWAVGDGSTILHTTDGGATWTPQTSPIAIGANDVEFLDASRGWVVGGGGKLLRTANGGATWTQQSIGTTNTLSSIDFADETTGWIAETSAMFVTTDGGDTWSLQANGVSGGIEAVSAVAPPAPVPALGPGGLAALAAGLLLAGAARRWLQGAPGASEPVP